MTEVSVMNKKSYAPGWNEECSSKQRKLVERMEGNCIAKNCKLWSAMERKYLKTDAKV